MLAEHFAHFGWFMVHPLPPAPPTRPLGGLSVLLHQEEAPRDRSARGQDAIEVDPALEGRSRLARAVQRDLVLARKEAREGQERADSAPAEVEDLDPHRTGPGHREVEHAVPPERIRAYPGNRPSSRPPP